MEVKWCEKEAYDFNYPSTYIVAAAIIYDRYIYAGMRHNICYRQIQNKGLIFDHKLQTGDGFIDNHGDFHDRVISMRIAKASGQTRGDNGRELYSEDLW